MESGCWTEGVFLNLATNPNGSAPIPFVIPSEAEGSAVLPYPPLHPLDDHRLNRHRFLRLVL
jgi:hypothetical protein